MKIELFIILILGIGWVWGVKCLFDEGMLLGFIGKLMRDKMPSWLSKPLFDCPPCMSSVHGTLVYLIFYPEGVFLWFFYIVVLCGVNYIIKTWLYE